MMLLILLAIFSLQFAVAAQSAQDFEKAMAAYTQRDYGTAAKLLPQFLDSSKEQITQYREAVAALGLSYHFLERHREAIPLLSKALEWNSRRSEFPYALALSCLRVRGMRSPKCFEFRRSQRRQGCSQQDS